MAQNQKIDFSSIKNDTLIVVSKRNLPQFLNLCYAYAKKGFIRENAIENKNNEVWRFDSEYKRYVIDPENIEPQSVYIRSETETHFVFELCFIHEFHSDICQNITRGLICALLDIGLATLHKTNERAEA